MPSKKSKIEKKEENRNSDDIYEPEYDDNLEVDSDSLNEEDFFEKEDENNSQKEIFFDVKDENSFAWFKEEDFEPLREEKELQEALLEKKKRKIEDQKQELQFYDRMTPQERREYLLKKEKEKQARKKEKVLAKLERFRENIEKTGVLYMSYIPPGMNAGHLRMLLQNIVKGSSKDEDPVEVGRIRMHIETPHERNVRNKKGGTWLRCGKEAWIEFSDKKIAKLIAESLNGTLMGKGAGIQFQAFSWNLKFLPKFKWHHLGEQDQYLKIERQKKIEANLREDRKSNEQYKKLAELSQKKRKNFKQKYASRDKNKGQKKNKNKTETENKNE